MNDFGIAAESVLKCSVWPRCKLTSKREAGYWVAYSVALWETHGEDLWRETRVAWLFKFPLRSSVSDDTQLTLATCESIIENGGVHAERLASHLATWFATGRVSGIGASTLKAMRDLVAGVHWALAGSRGEYSAGNGAAMRIAPLAFLLDPATPADRTVIRDVCRITHHNDEAYVGALAVVTAIRFIVSGVWSHENSLLVAVSESVPDSAVRDRIKQFLPLTVSPSEVASQFGASGWVVDSVWTRTLFTRGCPKLVETWLATIGTIATGASMPILPKA